MLKIGHTRARNGSILNECIFYGQFAARKFFVANLGRF